MTEDIENPDWERVEFNRVFHDAFLFFDDGGTPYIIYGAGYVSIIELEKDCSAVKEGGIVETPKGDWYALLFQDHGSVGRVPVLQPVTWEDGWPMMGEDGEAVSEITVLSDSDSWSTQESAVTSDDEFDYDEDSLSVYWQFNHNPDSNWSVTERSGWLRITTEDQARFYYSLDGEEWVKIGKSFNMTYSLDLFTGYRAALYCYSTLNSGGYADFDYYHIYSSIESSIDD